MKTNLSVETIADLSEGQAAAVINAAIRAALNDTDDRGADGKPRKATIELEFKKVGVSISTTVKAKTTLPPYVTEPTIGEVVMDGRQSNMRFNPSSNRVDQPTLPGAGRKDD